MVKFGFSPEGLCHEPRDNIARIRKFEEAGFDDIWEGDHTLPWQHSSGHNGGLIVQLTAFLERTQRVTVGGMVVPAIGIRRHPIDVALDFASLARLHPGRVALCVGTGEAMNEQTTTGLWPPLRERIERTTEAIELIRKAWTADDYFHWKGKHFTSFFYLYDKPEQPIPIYCAGNGPKMAYNAGFYADGHVAVGVPPSYYTEVLHPALERGARDAGKDPSKLEKFAWVSTFFHPDEEKALEAARRYGGLLIPECYHTIQDPRVIEERAQLVRDDILKEAFGVATKPEQIVERMEAFIKAGCNHILWVDGSPDPDLVAEVCKKEVIPELRRRHGN